MDEADDRRIGLGSKEGAQGFANLAVDELGLPVLVDQVVLELTLGKEAQRLSGLRRSVGDLNDPKEFLLDWHGRMAVVQAVLVAVAEGHPFDAGGHRVSQDLVRPLVVPQMGTKGLGLDEQARLAEEEQGVVDRVV